MLAVALDIGTSSVRAMAFDESGRRATAVLQLPYQQVTTREGGVQVSAPDLLELTARCLDGLCPRLPARPAVVGISCFWHSLMAVDAAGRPLTPVLMWADNRAQQSVELQRHRWDAGVLEHRTGCPLHASYWPARLHWLAGNCGGSQHWMGFAEYLMQEWMGEIRCSASMASATGLWNRHRAAWDAELLEWLHLDTRCLPRVGDEPGALGAEAAARWPELADAQWLPAWGDGACHNLGCGCRGPGQVAVNAGTSGAMRVIGDCPDLQAADGLWCYQAPGSRPLWGGALSNVGSVLLWAERVLQLPEDWPEQLNQRVPGGHGLDVLPCLAGERSPWWDARVRGVVQGTGLHTTSLDLLQALLEAVALRYAHLWQRMAPYLPAHPELILAGGMPERCPVWSAMLVDALGVPVRLNQDSEASARGAALAAMEAAFPGRMSPVAEARGLLLEPRRDNHEQWQQMLQRQLDLYRDAAGV